MKRGSTTVSYTHLDVYKRQACEAARQKNEKALAPGRVKQILADYQAIPVSYTHLDVYKRQGRQRMSAAAIEKYGSFSKPLVAMTSHSRLMTSSPWVVTFILTIGLNESPKAKMLPSSSGRLALACASLLLLIQMGPMPSTDTLSLIHI